MAADLSGENAAVPQISVIVPARNASATIRATLAALAAQEFDGPYEVIVVDDSSDDDTAAVARSAPGAVTVLSQEQRGPGPARNRGVQEARAQLLAFTDADCVPAPGWLREGVAALAGAELVQGAVRPPEDVRPEPFDRTIWVDGEAALYETANLLVTRELFDRVGGFEDWLDAGIGKPLAEDVWFGWRARRAGARIAFSREALVHHAVFRRGWRPYVAERLRLVYFPAIVKRIPELRRELLFARLFLNRRTAAFDAGVAGALAAVVSGSPLPLAAAVPYIWMLVRGAVGWRRHAPRVVAVEVLADAVGAMSLLAGSVRHRSPVL
jgi:glycosyltransferase involved in cell wall biosynthesis